MNIMVTGGAGFIGSNFIRYMLKEYNYSILNYDFLTYAGNLESLKDVEKNSRYHFIKGDIRNGELVEHIIKNYGIDIIVNFAAESHVDRSILDPSTFVNTNVLGTEVLLQKAREANIHKFVQISTDEVYGSLGVHGYFTEETPLNPNSPYSASKASADLLVNAYYETYGLNTVITRCSNNYGPYHFPEKLIPLFITNAFEGKELPIYGNGEDVRDWLHVFDHCTAIDLVIHQGKAGEIYHIGGNEERTNNEIAQLIVEHLKVPPELIRYTEDRLGHDFRYAIDSTKIMEQLGWQARYTFDRGLVETIQWYKENAEWWKNMKKGQYLNYYQKQYGNR